MPKTPTKEEAIRQVILDGGVGDYVDVADLVKSRFHLDVSVALVEQVAIQLRNERDATETAKNAPVNGVDASAPSAQATSSETSYDVALTLSFVEKIGGFHAAREAIDQLEHSLKNLSQSKGKT